MPRCPNCGQYVPVGCAGLLLRVFLFFAFLLLLAVGIFVAIGFHRGWFEFQAGLKP